MQEILHLINEMSPYLLLGFFLAGLMHAFIPGRYYTHYLSQRNLKSVLYAALFGIPLPLCSCGVIPTAMSLRKEGASKGATSAFMIATPQTGVDSIIATYSLMGWPFAILRPIAALLTSVFGGLLVNSFGDEAGSACNSCCSENSGAPRASEFSENSSLSEKLKIALQYAFVEMMQDIGKWLVIGLVAAGLITIFVPDSLFSVFQGNTFASMLLVLCIAVPMYLCATGSIPIAVALMLKGLTPGAALVLLMAGPACNVASILVVRKVLGTRTLITYLSAIILGAIGFGTLIDTLQFNHVVDFLANLQMQHACCSEPDSWFARGCTILLFFLLVNALVVQRILKKKSAEEQIEEGVSIHHVDGMNCNHCSNAVQKAVLALPDVSAVTVDVATKEVRVIGSASDEELRKAVESIGFSFID